MGSATGKLNYWKQRIDEVPSHIQQALWLLLVTASLTAIMTPLVWDFIETQEKRLELNEIASNTIISPRDFSVEDPEGRQRVQHEVAANVPTIFTFDDDINAQVNEAFETLFGAIKDASVPSTEIAAKLSMSDEERDNLQAQFRLSFEDNEWELLLDTYLQPKLADATKKLITQVLQSGVISNKRPLDSALSKSGAVLKRVSSGAEERLVASGEIKDLKEAIAEFDASFPTKGMGRGRTFDSLVRKLAISYVIKPNIAVDQINTESRRAQARENVPTSYNLVRRGEIIVSQGEVIKPAQARKLERLRELKKTGNRWGTAVSYTFLVGFVLAISFIFTRTLFPSFKPSGRDLMVLSLSLVCSFFLMKVFYSVFTSALSFWEPDIDTDVWFLATPFAAGGVLLQVTLGPASLFLYLLSFSVLTAVFLDASWVVLLMIVVGNIVGGLCVKRCGRRSVFVSAGLRIALVNMWIVLCYILLNTESDANSNLMRVACAVIGGWLSAFLSFSFTPIAEWIGATVSDIKLLELASLDRPLLRELSMEAPGTWNHSVVIGQMVEAAADSVGANGLLARVGAYYHDIGKAKKPGYFTENQSGKKNPHDKLAPSMSALIIRTHVKDGVEMARKNGLPKALIDFIPQHHGTALIEYFYDKARKEAEEDEEVDESLYRYSGPKPQTKEAGILMLADSIEASSRTLADPTPPKIQGLVQKMINKVFASGQLDESELTLKDLHLIAKNFTRVLSGIYHRRVEYSEPAEKVRQPKAEARLRNDADETAHTVIIPTVKEQKEQPAEGKENGRDNGSSNGEKQTQGKSADKAPNGNGKDALKRLGI